MRRALCVTLVLVLAAAGCQPATPTPTPAPPPSPQSVIVPLGSPTPAPTNTPSAAVRALVGRWLLDFRFDFTAGKVIDHTAFLMTAGVEVDESGQFSGRGEVATMVEHHPCEARVLSGGDFWARVTGQVEVDENGDGFLVVQLRPEDGMLLQLYRLSCPDRTTTEFSSQLLWQGLKMAEISAFRIPAEIGAQATYTGSIFSSGIPALNGDLEVTITANR
ncbi:MAG: hypothetical protein M5R40_13930 [Anaerolineae bacterium]|nr:hypothetical protein [Anaerolineae bacterium]